MHYWSLPQVETMNIHPEPYHTAISTGTIHSIQQISSVYYWPGIFQVLGHYRNNTVKTDSALWSLHTNGARQILNKL